MMILKGMIGLGIFVLPQTAKDLGWLGFSFFYTLIALVNVYFLSLVMGIADELNYHGYSYGRLHGIVLGENTS